MRQKPTRSKKANTLDVSCIKNMAIKYIVASRRTVPKILGMPGYLDFGFLTAITTTIKKAMISMMIHGVGNEEYEVISKRKEKVGG